MPETSHDHVRAIGEKLRSIRQDRRMSLRELAGSAEMSASMLSQIETGKASPSVRSLYNIAAALDVPVDYFFPDQQNGESTSIKVGSIINGEMTASEMREAQVGRAAEGISHTQSSALVVHANARPTIELKGGVTWSRLTMTAEPDTEFLEVTYIPGASSGANLSHHEGREFGLILEGELVVELGFDLYTLHCGDSIIFDSTTPHRLTNNGSKPTRALWVVLSRIA